MNRRKDEPTFQQLLEKHWYRMPPQLRQALRNVCQNPDSNTAKAWAERCIAAHAVAPTDEHLGTAPRDRMARAIINNSAMPSVRAMVLQRAV